jgi:hypothetical protein
MYCSSEEMKFFKDELKLKEFKGFGFGLLVLF